MTRALSCLLWSVVWVLSAGLTPLSAQDNDPPAQPAAAPAADAPQPADDAPQPADDAPAAKPAAKQDDGRYRRLAPGVLRTIKGEPSWGETVSRHNVVELLAEHPELDLAKNVDFRREIWCLDFQFKPLRFIWVDVPQPGGKMQRKLIRYLVYSVTNSGKAWKPEAGEEDGSFKLEMVDQPVRFIPEFLWENSKTGELVRDKIVPAALNPIRLREDPNRKFLTTVEMCREIPVGETVWGVAMWEDVSPRFTYVSIYVLGLTNAYKWYDEPGKFKAGDPPGTGRILARKALKLNFWRPGDEFYEHEDEVRFGVPGKLDYEWVYR